MPTKNDYVLKKTYRFTRYAILIACGFIIFNLIDLHTGVCKSIVEIPIVGLVCIFSWVFGYGLKQVMVVAAITSIGLMLTCKKIDYLLLTLLVGAFMECILSRFFINP